MASLIRFTKGYLVIQFRYRGALCREYTGRLDSRDNRRSLLPQVRAITRELKDGSFDYALRFPRSKALARFGLLPEKPTEVLTLSRQARLWLAAQEVSADTRRDVEYLFRVFLDRTALGRMPLPAVTPDDIRSVIRASTSMDRAKKFLQRLRSIYAQALDDGVVDKNPAARVKNPKRRSRLEPVQPWDDPADRLHIYNAAHGQDRAIIALVMGNGLRLGEALALRRKDIDFKTRKISIAAAVYRAHEKDTKNTSSTRVNDLIDNVLPVTTALQGLVGRIHTPLFANARGAFIDLANWRARNWRAILERAGLPYRNPNALRHSFAVAMIQNNHDPVYIGRLMGHTGPEMVLRRYARWLNYTAESHKTGDHTFRSSVITLADKHGK